FIQTNGGGYVNGLTGHGRIGAVDKHQNLGAHVVDQAVRIIHGNFYTHAGAPGDDGVVQIAIVGYVIDDIKGVGIFESVDQFAALAPSVAIENDGVNLAHVGIDAKT